MSISTISFRKYFKLNREIGIYCLKVCTILFFGIGILIFLLLYLTKGVAEDPITIIIGSALFGYTFAIFIFTLAISSAYQKAAKVFRRFNALSDQVKKEESLKVMKSIRPNENPKHYFIEFSICREANGKLEMVGEAEINKWLNN